MESSWTRVRQMVANRVLTRHLEDLHDQQAAMETAQEERKQCVERELRMSRNRAGSLIPSADTMLPAASRRHSLPVSPRLPANRSPPPTRHSQRPALAGDAMSGTTTKPLSVSTRHSTTNGIHDDVNLLEQMANTLQSADAMEKQRPSLYLQTPSGKAGTPSAGTQTSPRINRPLAASTKSQRVKAAAGGSPRLERGETFIQADQSQVLTFREDSSPTTTAKEDVHKKGAKTKRKRQKKGSVPTSTGGGLCSVDSGASKHEPAQQGRNVNVEFYDEETGLVKEDGGFTPKQLSLHLNMLEEEEENEDDNGEVVEEGEEDRQAEEKEGGLKAEDPWSEVKNCQYIRGYDPPHMQMPTDTVKFVFGEGGQT